MIRLATMSDIDFVLRAQRANVEVDQYGEQEVAMALSDGRLQMVILEHDKAISGVAILREGEVATLCGFYREGDRMGLKADAHRLLSNVKVWLNANGVSQIFADVFLNNCRYNILLKLYKSLGLVPICTRMRLEA